jgi:hypothetical protein
MYNIHHHQAPTMFNVEDCGNDYLGTLMGNADTNGFSVSVLKKRRRLIDLLRTKRPQEVVIFPHKKIFKGANVNNFRGSKFRGISKNGNSW